MQHPVPTLVNLKMNLIDSDGNEIQGALYAKVVATVPGSSTDFSVRFTSMPSEIRTFLRDHLKP